MSSPTTAEVRAARDAWQEAETSLHDLLPPNARPLGAITTTPAPIMVNAHQAVAAIDLARSRYEVYLDLLHSMHRRSD